MAPAVVIVTMSGFKLIPFRTRVPGFEQTLAPHIESLYRLAYRFTGARHDAEDLVQELLVRLYPKRKELGKVEKLRPWLARSLHNLYIDSLRSRQRSPLGHVEQDSEVHLELVRDVDPGPSTRIEQQDRTQQIESALAQLSEVHRSLIIMHDMEGFTLPELTQVFDTPLGTLKSRLHRARNNLRELLRTEPFDEHRRVNG